MTVPAGEEERRPRRGVLVSLLQRLAEQFRKPEGLPGRVLSLLMERGNRAAND